MVRPRKLFHCRYTGCPFSSPIISAIRKHKMNMHPIAMQSKRNCCKDPALTTGGSSRPVSLLLRKQAAIIRNHKTKTKASHQPKSKPLSSRPRITSKSRSKMIACRKLGCNAVFENQRSLRHHMRNHPRVRDRRRQAGRHADDGDDTDTESYPGSGDQPISSFVTILDLDTRVDAVPARTLSEFENPFAAPHNGMTQEEWKQCLAFCDMLLQEGNDVTAVRPDPEQQKDDAAAMEQVAAVEESETNEEDSEDMVISEIETPDDQMNQDPVGEEVTIKMKLELDWNRLIFGDDDESGSGQEIEISDDEDEPVSEDQDDQDDGAMAGDGSPSEVADSGVDEDDDDCIVLSDDEGEEEVVQVD